MSQSCPVGPEWNALVAALGKGDATTALLLNGPNKMLNDIPTVDQAKDLLKKLMVEDKDEQMAKSSDSYNLIKATELRTRLESAKTSPGVSANPSQVKTLDMLIENLNQTIAFHRSNLVRQNNGEETTKTVSVSTFMGSSEFKDDPTKFEGFKLFGTFMHEVIEKAQLLANREGGNISNILTKDFFDKVHDEFQSKNQFEIAHMTKDMMYVMTQSIANQIAVHNDQGFIILPEVTISGRTNNGSFMVGRIDMMLIDSTGKIKVIDFKTKKCHNLITTDSVGKREVNKENALVELADESKEIQRKLGTHERLAKGKRSTYDSWTLQLQIYNNLLQQAGLDVANQSIVGLLYQTNDDNQFQGAALQVFNEENFYTYAGVAVNRNGKINAEDKRKKIDGLRNLVDEVIPTGKKTKAEETKQAKEDFVPTKEQNDKVTERITSSIESELSSLNKQINLVSKNNNNPEALRVLKQHRDTLLKLKVRFQNMNADDKTYSVNFSLALSFVKDELANFEKDSLADIEKIRNTNTKDLSQQNPTIAAMTIRFQKSRTIAGIVDALSDVVSEARREKMSGLSEDSEVFKDLEMLRSMIAGVEADFREASLKCVVKILKSPGEKSFQGVKRDIDTFLFHKIKAKKEELEKIKAGKFVGVWSSLKSKTLSFISKEFKDALAKKMGNGADEFMNEIEKRELEIMKLEALSSDNVSYDDDSLEKYVKGVTNPASKIFIGNSDIYNPSAILSGFGSMLLDPGSLIAGASSADLGISSMVLFLKNAEASMRKNIQQDLIALDFDKRMEKMLKRYTLEQLNDKISEWRTVTYRDKDGKLQTKEELYIAKPYSEGYEHKYTEFNSGLKDYTIAIAEIEQKVYASFGKPEHEDLKKELIAKRAERDLYKSQYIQWMTDNCSLPYVDDFYKLQQMLPEEIREPLQKYYLEMEILQHVSGAENRSSVMGAEDFDRMQEIQIEIRKLRARAKEINPQYAEYMDKFNEMYEYEEDEEAYKRAYDAARAKYEGTPYMDEWLKQNEVMTPTTEWYERLGELFEERAALYSGASDPGSERIGELMERKREIMRPHKVNGKFTSKYMMQDEISELDSIHAEIDNIIAEKEASKSFTKLTGSDRDRARDIKNEINRISATKISSNYVETFNTYTRLLEAKKNAFYKAEQEENKLKDSGTAEEKDAATKNKMAAAAEFTRFETEYQEWYDKNHENKYESVLSGFDVYSKIVKPFNYERVPTDEVAGQYLQAKHPKFTKRTLKESAKNPNYHLSADNIPMPKGLEKGPHGELVINKGVANPNNLNAKYNEIMADPELKEFYDALTNMHFGLQKKVEGQTVGYKVPGYAASTVENIVRKGLVGSIQSESKKFMDANLNIHGEQDLAANVFGDAGQVIRMGHSHQLSKDIQTQDTIGAIVKYALEAHHNIAMQEVAPMTDAYIQHLELLAEDLKKEIQKGKTTYTDAKGNVITVDMSKRLSDLEKVIEAAKFERDKYVYGQTEFSNSEASRKLKKIINGVFKYTSFIRLSFDMAAQTKNYFSGNIQAFIAAGGNKSDHYSSQDFFWAKGKMYGYDGFLANYFKDWGKVSDISESTMLYRLMNPAQKDYSHYLGDITAGRTRRMAGKLLNLQEMGYMLQENGDTEIAVTVMYAVMKHYKFEKIKQRNPDGSLEFELDDKGNPVLVSASDAYTKDSTGMLVRRPDVNYTEEDENRLRNVIYSEMRRTQGNYAKADMTRFERGIPGKLVYFYRKYLVPQLLNRFGYLRPNYEAGETAWGYWRAVYASWKYFGPVNTLKQFVLGSKYAKKFGADLDSYEVVDPATGQPVKLQGDLFSRKIDQARRDAIAMGIVSMMGMMLVAALRGRDDDEPVGMIEGNMMRVLWGVKGETLAMFPLGGGSDEYIRNFTTISVYTREVQAAGRFASHAWCLGRAKLMGLDEMPDRDEDPYSYELYKGAYYTRKSGSYEKGDVKILKDFVDFSGMRNFRNLVHPNDMVQQQKRQQ